jgi:hypothetical protein
MGRAAIMNKPKIGSMALEQLLHDEIQKHDLTY